MLSRIEHPQPAAGAGVASAAPSSDGAELESRLAAVLAGVVDVEQVPLEGNFFDDLDADSMVMARFCARIRKQGDLPSVSMKDVYRHPTVAALAAELRRRAADEHEAVEPPVTGAGTGPAETLRTAISEPAQTPVPASAAATPKVTRIAGRPRVVLCGAVQASSALAYAYLLATALALGFDWLNRAVDLWGTYLRALVFGAGALLVMCLVPILAKWVLIGRWKPGAIRVWSPAYLRFWCVKTLMRANPLVLFAGSPIYSVYLRLMGAKVGRGVVVYSPTFVCTDLLTIGDRTVIRKDALLPGYRAIDGAIETGPVSLGSEVIVGERTVIEINTSVGDRARLGHSSSLQAGQHIPDGERWQGSPARSTGVAFPDVAPARCGTPRRVLFSLWQVGTAVGLYVPLTLCVPVLIARIPRLAPLVATPPVDLFSRWTYYGDLALVAAAVYLVVMVINLLVSTTVPRLLNRALTPGRVYPLYGFHYWVQRFIARRTNSAFFTTLFGDSSYVVHYLRLLGYDLGRYEQTGSNFGSTVKHDNPYLCSVGPGTMVADGLSMINIDYSGTSFRLAPVAVGSRSFLGNQIAYPAHATVGDNCLLATKVMVPVDGPVRHDRGLLGSPTFEIPRTVERDTRLVVDPDQRRRLLRAKNRHNLVTIGLYLASRWTTVFLTLLLTVTAALEASLGGAAVLAVSTLSWITGSVYLVALQRSVNRLQVLRPQGCSIYTREFWRHERYWKIPSHTWVQAFNGTPFKPIIWRALGVRIGRRVFDDGLTMPEKCLVTIGDDCTFNTASIIQCHSQEDGAFKSDRTTIGNGVTLGLGAFIHYGVTIGDNAVLAADTFVMKGEDVPTRTRWTGNPAAPAQSGLGGIDRRLEPVLSSRASVSPTAAGVLLLAGTAAAAMLNPQHEAPGQVVSPAVSHSHLGDQPR